MRRLLLLGVLVLSAVAAGASTHSATSAPSAALPNVSCNQKTLVFLFWPNGHGAIKSVGFSAYKTPHLEVYKHVSRYPNSAFLAFAASNKLTSFAKACRGKSGKVGGPIQRSKTATKQRLFSCTMAKGCTDHDQADRGRPACPAGNREPAGHLGRDHEEGLDPDVRRRPLRFRPLAPLGAKPGGKPLHGYTDRLLDGQ